MSSFNFIFANFIFIATYIFIVLEKIPRVVVVLLGASSLMVAKVISQEEAFSYIDFNVLSLLVGMMILVNILAQTGALKVIAFYIAKKARNSGVRLMSYLAIATALLSGLLDKVTTVLIIVSFTLTLAK